MEQVGHAQWVFTIPKMLRIYFLHHRELLGALSLAAYQTVKELMAAAAVEEKGFRPGMVSVVQTFGEGAKFHPHVHALCSRIDRILDHLRKRDKIPRPPPLSSQPLATPA